jgi:hypothetical protein
LAVAFAEGEEVSPPPVPFPAAIAGTAIRPNTSAQHNDAITRILPP